MPLTRRHLLRAGWAVASAAVVGGAAAAYAVIVQPGFRLVVQDTDCPCRAGGTVHH